MKSNIYDTAESKRKRKWERKSKEIIGYIASRALKLHFFFFFFLILFFGRQVDDISSSFFFLGNTRR